MADFVLDRVPRMTQGAGALSKLGAVAAALGGTAAPVLLVADPGLRATGTIDQALSSLRDAGLTALLFDDIESNPSTTQADRGADLARRERVGLVVALGGGSAMDVGKTIAAIAPAAELAEAYQLCAIPLPAQSLKKICVPTTSGTGSESTRTSVLTTPDHIKVWLWGDPMKAEEIILDPLVTIGLPPHLTAATGIDVLVHAIEASTNANAFPANTMFCQEAIRLVVRHLPTAVERPTDVEARAGMQLAAALAGIAIDNTGTAVAHNIGHALASLRPVHHGRAVGLAMMATLGWNVVDDDGRFAQAAAAMGEPADAARLPVAFERLVRRVGLKVSLAGEGHDDITPERLAHQMAEPENVPMRRSNRRPIADADLLVFARAVLMQS